MAESLGHKAARGAVWASIEKFCMMGLQFGVNLILARLLLPVDFGAIGMLAIFIAVSQVLIDGGFGSALIQKKSPTQTDYSTIFYWNLAFSSLLYLILFLCAPIIADYFAMPVLSGVLRGIGLSLIINGVLAVQRVRLQKSLAFKTLAVTNLSAYMFGSIVAIIMAYNNGGVWSLVVMQVVSGIVAVAVLAIITRWIPSLIFSKYSMRQLFGFGGYMLAANILQEICRNVQGLVIGKKYSAAQLGYYTQAYKLEGIVGNSIPQVISQVMFPVFSNLQNDPVLMSVNLDKSIRLIAFIVLPIIGGLMLFAEPVIYLLYGDNWLPCVPYYQVFCVGGFVTAYININFFVVAAIGQSKRLFYWSFYKWGVLLTAILIGMNFGVLGIVWGVVLSNFNTYIVNACLACSSLRISIWSQFWSWGHTLPLVAVSMLAGYFLYGYCGFHFIIGLLAYAAAYLALSLIFNHSDLKKIIQLMRKLRI